MRHLLISVLVSASAAAKPRVACTGPTVEAIVREVAGDRVETFSLASGDQDPHFVSPTPSLMNRVRRADVLVEIGMQLEPWADEVANGSGNPDIFRGAAGRISISAGVPKLEVPAVLSREQGDIHPEGNPHLWLDPVRARMLADNAARALAARFPADAATFEARARDFGRRIDEALFGKELLALVGSKKLGRLVLDGKLDEFLDTNQVDGQPLRAKVGGWLKKGAALRGQNIVEFHKVWVYFAHVFGMHIVATVEEKPGIAPGPRHVEELVATMKRQQVRRVLVDNFYDPGTARHAASAAGARVVILPSQVGGEPGVTDYFRLIDHVLDKLRVP